jgi:DNA replication initiation complex subunit (GINS family)
VAMQDLNITLETLYDILINEKKREDLQKLNISFFFDVVNYLKEKKTILEDKKDEDDLFAAGEQEKLEYELKSIKKILKEIYEKREKKIIDIALNKSRTKSDIIDTSAMLKEEKDFYGQLIGLLDGYREGILLNLFRGEVPFFQKPDIKINSTVKRRPELSEKSEENLETSQETTKGTNEIKARGEQSFPMKTNETEENKSQLKKIRFLHPVPSFVWKDMKEYGPYEKGEETELFEEVADLIIEKERAEEV